jgi:hypothetical protein
MIRANRDMPHSGATDMNHLPMLPLAAGPASADVLVAGCTPGADGTHPVDVAAASPVGSTGDSSIVVPLDTTLTFGPDGTPSAGHPWSLTATPGLPEVPVTP